MELFRALAAVTDRPGQVPSELLELLELPSRPERAAHTALFTFELPPYASIYLGDEGMLGGEARDRVAGFFRALSAVPPAEADHLAVLLHAAAELAQAERTAEHPDEIAHHRRARSALLREHLLPWLPVYLEAVVASAPEPYRSWAQTLAQALQRHTEALGTGEELPVHLTEARGLPDPRDGASQDFFAALLAPVRTGLLVTRSTLARAAQDLGLALRIGERRYVLRNLMDQAPSELLAWLAQQAGEASEHYARHLAWSGPSGAFWRERAAATAALLDDVAGQAAEVLEHAEPVGSTDGLVS